MIGMGRVLYTLLFIAALSPSGALAQIVSTTESEVDTGGNSAGGVVETGAAGSSVKTTNVVGEEGGTVEIEVRTETNGTIKTESIEKQVPGAVEVNVSATSKSGAVNVEKKVEQGKVSVTVNGTSESASNTPFWTRIPFPTWFWQAEPKDAELSEASEEGLEVEVASESGLASSPPFGDLRGLFKRLFSFLSFF